MSTSAKAISRILVVEDEPKLRRSLANGLCLEDWDVTTAAAGGEAQAILENQSFDAIVLDWMLPDSDGLEIVRQLRTRGSRVPVLIISAQGRASAAEAIREAGATDYLAKPFSLDDLLARTRALLTTASSSYLRLSPDYTLTITENSRGGANRMD
jgi:DNA-binding response OmpR family regulator